METSNALFEYSGRFYARPAYRGICLEDLQPNAMWSDDLADIVYDLIRKVHSHDSGVSGTMTIRLEITGVEPV